MLDCTFLYRRFLSRGTPVDFVVNKLLSGTDCCKTAAEEEEEEEEEEEFVK